MDEFIDYMMDKKKIRSLLAEKTGPKYTLDTLREYLRRFKLDNKGSSATKHIEWTESFIPQLKEDIEELRRSEMEIMQTHFDLLSQPKFALVIFYLISGGYLNKEDSVGNIKVAIDSYDKTNKFSPDKLGQYLSYIYHSNDKYFNKKKIQSIRPFLNHFPKAINQINKDLKDASIAKDNRKKV